MLLSIDNMFSAVGVWLEQPDTLGHGGQRQRRLQVGSRKIFQGSKIFTMPQHCRCEPSNARQDQIRVNIIKGEAEGTESADMMGGWSQDNGGILMGKNNNVIIFIHFPPSCHLAVLLSLTLTRDGSEIF